MSSELQEFTTRMQGWDIEQVMNKTLLSYNYSASTRAPFHQGPQM